MNIYLDTETIPAQRPEVIAWLAARQHIRDAEDGVTDFVEKAKRSQKALRDTSLSPVLGELAVISFATDNNEPITFVRDMTDPYGERALVARFAQEMFDLSDDTGGFARSLRRIVAFKEEFDRKAIRSRAMLYGIKLPPLIHALGLKPWDSPWFCAQEALKGDWKDHLSLDAACVGLGVGLPKGDIDGSKVWDAICAGRIDEVAAYCADDVRRVRAVYQKIVGVRG